MAVRRIVNIKGHLTSTAPRTRLLGVGCGILGRPGRYVDSMGDVELSNYAYGSSEVDIF
jgi:hypothetical protein